MTTKIDIDSGYPDFSGNGLGDSSDKSGMSPGGGSYLCSGNGGGNLAGSGAGGITVSGCGSGEECGKGDNDFSGRDHEEE